MGQYFNAVIWNDKTSRKFSMQSKKFTKLNKAHDKDAFRYYNGIKLFEHSWMGNHLCKAVCKSLYNNPMHLVWLGDYADAGAYNYKLKFVWDSMPHNLPESDYSATEAKFSLRGKFALNHDKKEFIDFDTEYLWDYNKNWRFFPLSYLTCSDENGIWCGDLIEISDNVPFGYEELDARKYIEY